MKKALWSMIGITCAFILVLLGMFLGRNTANAYIPTDKTLKVQTQNATESNKSNDGKIDINTATSQQLQLLPGIGETIAQRIIDYRTEHGAFKTVDDLLNVNGIGQSKLEQMLPYIKTEENAD